MQIKNRRIIGGFMVEARGVEPLSENRPTRLSPSALGIFHSLARAPAQRVPGLVASSLAVKGSKLSPNRAPPNGVSAPPGGQGGRNVAALRCECDFVFVRVYFFCRLLSQFRRLRLAYPASRVPVETVTPPCTCYFCRSRNARSISRASSLALAAARLSYSFLPLQTPTSSFALFLEK